MEHSLLWLESHIGSIEAGIELINSMSWNISVKTTANRWFVLAGDQPVFSSESRSEVDTFLYGMALAYSLLSDNVIQIFKREAGID